MKKIINMRHMIGNNYGYLAVTRNVFDATGWKASNRSRVLNDMVLLDHDIEAPEFLDYIEKLGYIYNIDTCITE